MNLRNLGLKPIDIATITHIISQENNKELIKSISFSYNNLIGDIGVTEIVRCLPSSISEIGLVGCGIGDKGGNKILSWIKTAPNLKMICIEQNNFSDQLKTEFRIFKKSNPQILVLV